MGGWRLVLHKVIINFKDGELWNLIYKLASYQQVTIASWIRTACSVQAFYQRSQVVEAGKDGKKIKKKKEEGEESESELNVKINEIRERRVPTLGISPNPIIMTPFPTACVTMDEAKLLVNFDSEVPTEQAKSLQGWDYLSKSLISCEFLGKLRRSDGATCYKLKRRFITKDIHEQQDCCESRTKGKDRLWREEMTK